ncbi:MAG: 2-phospho-L-lactate guanylyltransferase [Actinomycetota bacterium]|nr:2-phospho-L-lactate guanylyltransferase [Actinomycetota bacterium]
MVAALAAVVTPLRSFSTGKSRLFALGADKREDIGRLAAEAVLAAGGPYQSHVVTADPEVASWASHRGASVIICHGASLNADLEEALEVLGASGFHRAVIALGDLPLLRKGDVDKAAASSGFFLIPDRHRAGTNLLACDLPCPIRLAFGEGSFAAHLAAISNARAPLTIDAQSLARYDIDLPEDLDALAALDAGESLTAAERHRLNSILSLAGRPTA